MCVKPETGDRSAGNLATISRMASVVKTRPFSYEWSDQMKTVMNLIIQPAKTTIALEVGKEDKWKTSL